MTRKRIQELAKEWGVSVHAILSQLEKIGVTGKKPQHVLGEKEGERVKIRLGLTPPPTPVVGQERLVSTRVVVQPVEGHAKAMSTTEQVVERRVGAQVIRRRTTRVAAPQQPTLAAQEQPATMAPPVVTPPPIAFELAPTEEALLPFVPSTPSPQESVPEPMPVLARAASSETPLTASPRPSRVLGRIDLKKATPASQPVRRVDLAPATVTRAAQVRLLRDHVVVYQGKIASLRRFKDDVREVMAGYECGVGLEHFQDLKADDVLEAFELEQVVRRLELHPAPHAERRLSA